MKQTTRNESAFVRDYRKAYMKLLSAVTNVPKAVDEYFFMPAEERDEYEEGVRPYFYGSLSFIIAVGLFIFVSLGKVGA